MKIFTKFHKDFAEIDDEKDALEFIKFSLLSFILYGMFWILGFAIGALCISYLLEHPGFIFGLLAKICKILAEF